MKYTVKELRAIAQDGESADRPWFYTGDCHMCGGVKAFLDWLEEQNGKTD